MRYDGQDVRALPEQLQQQMSYISRRVPVQYHHPGEYHLGETFTENSWKKPCGTAPWQDLQIPAQPVKAPLSARNSVCIPALSNHIPV